MGIFYRTAAEDAAIARNVGKTPSDGLPAGQARGGNVVIKTEPGSGTDTSKIPNPSHVRDGSRAPYVPAS